MDKVLRVIQLVEKQVKGREMPSVTKISRHNNPYCVLISCILSLRTKDKITEQASKRLFSVANTAGEMVKLSATRIQRLIYPVGFYRNKAKVILQISRKILDDFEGRVPADLDGLLSLKGVGRKTANLVLGLGYRKPAICVDTHVHRISNRLGWVDTKTVSQTEEALKTILPLRYWIRINTIFVAFGQSVCTPVSPFCSKCLQIDFCAKKGVKKWR
jgi:endonuclease-3